MIPYGPLPSLRYGHARSGRGLCGVGVVYMVFIIIRNMDSIVAGLILQ